MNPTEAISTSDSAPSGGPKPNSASRLFGYDVFISFPLGPAPRGARDYASDLARKLRERQLTVFYSEENLPPGAPLSPSLTAGLSKAHALVVVLNTTTLAEPRWVRTEVESFRRRHPKRPLLAIGLDRALTEVVVQHPDQDWLGLEGRVWIDDSAGAEANDSAVDSVVRALVDRKRNELWRWTQAGVFTALTGLSVGLAFATWNARQSERAAMKAAEEATAGRLAADIPAALKGGKDGGERGNGDRPAMLMALAAMHLGPSKEVWESAGQLLKAHRRTDWLSRGTARTTAFSPDGAWLIQGSFLFQGQASFWIRDSASGRILHGPTAHDRALSASAIRQDGRVAALGDDRGRVLLLDPKTGLPISAPFATGLKTVNTLAFLPGTGALLAADGATIVRVDLNGDQIELPAAMPEAGIPFALATCGEVVMKFEALADGQIAVTALDDAVSTAPRRVGRSGNPRASVLAADCHGRRVFSISNGRLRAWQNTGSSWPLAWEYPSEPGLPKDARLFASDDGRRLLLVSENKLVIVDASTGTPTSEMLTLNVDAGLISLSPDGQRAVLSTGDFSKLRNEMDIRAVDLRDGVALPDCRAAVSHRGPIQDIVVTADVVAYTAGADGSLQSCRLLDGKSSSPPVQAARVAIERIAVEADGRHLLAASADGRISRWELPSLKHIGDVPRGDWKDESNATVFSSGAGLIFREAGTGTEAWGIWETQTGKRAPARTPNPNSMISSSAAATFSPDGQWMLTGWDVLPPNQNGPGVLWSLKESAAPIVELGEGLGANSALVAFSASSRRFAVAGRNAPKIYDSASRPQPSAVTLDQLEVPNNGPTSAAFNPKSDDWIGWIHGTTVQHWQLDSGSSASEQVDVKGGSLTAMAYAPDGTRLVLGTSEGKLLVITPPWEWAAELCRKLDADMTPEEWRAWISPKVAYKAQCAWRDASGPTTPSAVGR